MNTYQNYNESRNVDDLYSKHLKNIVRVFASGISSVIAEYMIVTRDQRRTLIDIKKYDDFVESTKKDIAKSVCKEAYKYLDDAIEEVKRSK